MELTAAVVKAKARELGADSVGIANAAILNAHPPDPSHPQTPERISPETRACIAFTKRIPAGAFRARDNACVHHVDQLVLREMDKISYRLSRFLEDHGSWAFPTAAQETVWEMKNASYGFLSTRHIAIEAGLGTIRSRAQSADTRVRAAMLYQRCPHRRRPPESRPRTRGLSSCWRAS